MTDTVRCPLCADARPLYTPAEAREHYTTAHPEWPLTGPGPWPMLGTQTDPTCTIGDLAHALDNATPYPIELDPRVCRFMAERLLEMVHVTKRPEHVVWEYEAPPSPGPEPEACPAAPRDALSAPQTAEPPAPGPERHPGGENGPHTGTQRADGERRQRYARALRTTPATGHTHKPGQEKWDHHPLPGEQGHRYTYTCALCRGDIDALTDAVMAVADAQLAEQAAIDTQVMEKADRECDEHIAAGRAFRQLAEQAQAWGEQHRDRANRYRARVDRVRALHVRNQNTGHCEHCSERDYPDYAVPHPCPTIRALDAPQAGDDTTGDTP